MVTPSPTLEPGKGETPAMADRRSRVLAVAMRRFAEFGFAVTTVRQIADDVGILSGSLYHHFATKEEMLDAIVRDAVLRLRENTLRIAGAPESAELRLLALILVHLVEYTSYPAENAILFHERKFFRRSADFAYVAQAKREGYDAWCAVLADGIVAGLFHPDMDIFLTVSTILRMLNTGADRHTNEEGTIDTVKQHTLDELLQFYLDFVLRSVRNVSRTAEPIARGAAEKLAGLPQIA